ncbi:MAG: glycosyltransferase [Planctomycetota bacterium]
MMNTKLEECLPAGQAGNNGTMERWEKKFNIPMFQYATIPRPQEGTASFQHSRSPDTFCRDEDPDECRGATPPLSVSVVIPVHNGAFTIAQTIESCLAQDYSGPLEIIVVDDGSTDNMAEIVKKYSDYVASDFMSDNISEVPPGGTQAGVVACLDIVNAFQKGETTVESRPKRGPAAARNTGWRAARGDIIVFTDADCLPPPDWVSRLISGFNIPIFQHSSFPTGVPIGAVGGGYQIANSDNLLAVCIQAEMAYRYNRMPANTKFLSTHNLAIRRDVLKQINGFDESYPDASAEDNDLIYRMQKAGYGLLLQKENQMPHHHATNIRKYLRKQFQHAFWRVKLYSRHPGMAKGDDYTGLKDVLEPFLALFILSFLVCFPLFITYNSSFITNLTCDSLLATGCFLIIWQLFWAVKVVYKNSMGEDKLNRYKICNRALFLALVGFLRSFARGLGMAAGIFIHLFVKLKTFGFAKGVFF